ncbi:MAG TPA: hypothetical protein ENL02_01490, partial [Epsilonproteobacteria bacterium]|nr:hypothetical protein [Campylobacterota bacterium]
MKALINGKIIYERKVLDGYTLLFDKKIIALSKDRPPAQSEVIDAEGCYVSAGFVDMHIHGSGGADVMDATPEMGIPGTILMENAGRGVADIARRMLEQPNGKLVHIYCGAGSNGG